MRAVFGLVGLLVVVAIVMVLGKKQLQAVAPASADAPPAAGGTPSTVQEQSRRMQQKVLQDVNQSLQQGAERAADPKP